MKSMLPSITDCHPHTPSYTTIFIAPGRNKPVHKQKMQMKPMSHKSKTIPTVSLLFVIHTTEQNAITKATTIPKSITAILNTSLSKVAVLIVH